MLDRHNRNHVRLECTEVNGYGVKDTIIIQSCQKFDLCDGPWHLASALGYDTTFF